MSQTLAQMIMDSEISSQPVSSELTSNTIPNIDFFVRPEYLLEDLRVLLKIVIPLIPGIAPDATPTMKQETIGTMNYAFKVTVGEETMMVRIFGSTTNLLVDRKREAHVLHLVHKYGYGAKMYAQFNNGYVIEFIPGTTLSLSQLRDPFYYTKIATQFAKWHQIKLNQYEISLVQVNLWEIFEKWYKLADHFGINVEKIKQEIKEFTLGITDFISEPGCFTHNDLNAGNIIYNEQTQQVFFVDYEFAGYGNMYFDLANHFCEWSGIDFDFSLYPPKETQISFLEVYFNAMYPSLDQEEKKCMVQIIWSKVNRFQLMSHLFWGLWGTIMASQEINSDIFDYNNYAQKRLNTYYNTKEDVLKMEIYTNCDHKSVK